MNKSGLYIHIPFCRRKCNYCDFYLITNLNVIEKFLENLLKEIELLSKTKIFGEFDTIFFGGGTPSVLTGKQIDNILNSLNKFFIINEKAEISIESNPEDFINDANKLSEYSTYGINRLSLGIQSFVDKELKFLTRQHNANEAETVINQAKKYFKNISVDIIYSLPSQNLDDLNITLNKVCKLNIPHISAYTLIFEKNTVLYNEFKKNNINQNSDFLESELYHYLTEYLLRKGYEHYEVSNYSVKGFESEHNKKYWNYENYLGLGPGAHSFINYKRWNNVRNIMKYNISLQNNNLPVENECELNSNEMNTEFIMLGLRSAGVNLINYERIFKCDFINKYRKEITLLTDDGYGFTKNNFFRLTEKGYAILDEIVARFF